MNHLISGSPQIFAACFEGFVQEIPVLLGSEKAGCPCRYPALPPCKKCTCGELRGAQNDPRSFLALELGSLELLPCIICVKFRVWNVLLYLQVCPHGQPGEQGWLLAVSPGLFLSPRGAEGMASTHQRDSWAAGSAPRDREHRDRGRNLSPEGLPWDKLE